MTLLLQLLFLGLAPAADARASAADASASAGVHIEKQGMHHPVHDAEDCAFCIAMQAGATPAPLVRAPDGGAPLRAARTAEQCASFSPAPSASPVARAPPVA